jgi:predicted adenine nucleotide alpha hydrolase (AANH) superfamily ATPase
MTKKLAGKNKVLLHTCCAPCTTYVHKSLVKDGYGVSGFFYNPNIHPYTEYEKRLTAMKLYSIEKELHLIYADLYDIENFFEIIYKKGDKRCLYCYMLRLHKTASHAKKDRFNYFSTTLLLSPYQQHDLLKEAGEIVSKKIGIPFLYKDFRPGYKESIELSKSMGLYRQKYCGCLYSERERFMPKTRGEVVKN